MAFERFKQAAEESTELNVVPVMNAVDAVRISCASVSLTPEELDALGSEWVKKDGKYQVDAIQQALIDIKRTYPESNTITVLPFEDLEYQTLVGILDKTRNRQSGTDADGEPVYEELFPVTIFSRFVPPEPEAAEDEDEAPAEGGDE